jgi:aubergine-like protein
MSEGTLQELFYSQCFNYMNWSGSVRVPSVCQYSRKISTFVAENIKDFKDSDSRINERLYFI